MNFLRMTDLDLAGKRVLIREDLNVPMQDGSVSDDTRLRSAMPTVLELADRGAKVFVLAHFGRPKGERNPGMSLAPIVQPLAEVLGLQVADLLPLPSPPHSAGYYP